MINFNKQSNLLIRSSRLKKRYKEYDLLILGIPSLLVLLGTCLIASTQRQVELANWYDQLITALIGIVLALFIAKTPLDRIRNYLFPIYFSTIILLLLVSIFGTSAFGAQRWLSIFGLNIQPSEIAKITSIIVLAGVLDSENIDKPEKLLKPIGIVFIPWTLVFLQPDLGTSLVFGSFLLVMLYWSGMPYEWGLICLSFLVTAILSGVFKISLILWIPFLGVLAFRSLPRKIISTAIITFSQLFIAIFTPWLWENVLRDYQRDRISLFIDPSKDPLGGGYHLIQSQIGIGSGGLFGSGLFNGQLTKLKFIPEQHTDFIFSALGEETGFLGSIFVIVAFFFLALKLLKLSKSARTNFESLVVVGITSMFIFQVVVNIFMNIGLGPVTGIPLPFLSYGRTALIVNFVSLGFCLSVARRSSSLSKGL